MSDISSGPKWKGILTPTLRKVSAKKKLMIICYFFESSSYLLRKCLKIIIKAVKMHMLISIIVTVSKNCFLTLQRFRRAYIIFTFYNQVFLQILTHTIFRCKSKCIQHSQFMQKLFFTWRNC